MQSQRERGFRGGAERGAGRVDRAAQFGREDSTAEDDLVSLKRYPRPPIMTEAKAVGVQELGLTSGSTVKRLNLSVPAGLLTGAAVLSPVEKACCKNMQGEK